MKDLHSHLLPSIDDGVSSLEESLSIIESAYKSGVTDIMITPHYIEGTSYNANNKTKLDLFSKLQKELKDKNININIYLGNEIYINDNIDELIKRGEIYTLNNTKYVLVELPLEDRLKDDLSILHNLKVKGYKVILAHPERYLYIQKNKRLINDYLNVGVLLQGNYKSLFNEYGKQSKKLLKYLLKNEYISFLGSDIHHSKKYQINKLLLKMKFITTKTYRNNILYNNFNNLLDNKDI